MIIFNTTYCEVPRRAQRDNADFFPTKIMVYMNYRELLVDAGHFSKYRLPKDNAHRFLAYSQGSSRGNGEDRTKFLARTIEYSGQYSFYGLMRWIWLISGFGPKRYNKVV